MSQQINLYNAAFIPERQWLTAQSLAIATGAMLVVLSLAATMASFSERKAARAADKASADLKLAQAAFEAEKRSFDARKPSLALQSEVAQAQTLLSMREEVLAALGKSFGEEGKSGAGFGDYLKGLARQSRNGLWLTGFKVDAADDGMTLSGRAQDKAMLPDYVRRLNAEPAFIGKSFAGLQIDARDTALNPANANAAVPPSLTSGAQGGPTRYLEFKLVAELVAEPTR